MEDLMQYVWQFRLWPLSEMVTVDGERVRVIDVGVHNKDAGPDFFNAKILIGEQEWIGNVEIHVRASDWARHGHHLDKAYDSVILHVVERSDARVQRSNGEVIPQMVMTCAPDFSVRYHEMVNNVQRELSCSGELPSISPLYISDWLTSLGFQRLQMKSDRILSLLERVGGNWYEAAYITLARALGFSTNAEPFELLALSTPLKHMLRTSDSLLSIEAMLFGQAGLLPDCPSEGGDEAYVERLIQDYAFYKAKYGLEPSNNLQWKMARMRPQNFPHRRIAALATLLYSGIISSGALLNVSSEDEARALFDVNLMGYWTRRCNFGKPSATGCKAFSHSSITVLLINVVAPLLYANGQFFADDKRMERAIDLLHQLKPERNSIIDLFGRAGIMANDAFTTQALIQLRKEFCLPRKCLFCRIGHKLLSSKVKRQI